MCEKHNWVKKRELNKRKVKAIKKDYCGEAFSRNVIRYDVEYVCSLCGQTKTEKKERECE